MKKNILYDFWRRHVNYGFHPDDKKTLQEAGNQVLDWTPVEAKKNQRRFDKNKSWHKKIHKNLLPKPFFGNLDTAKIFLHYGNLGFDPTKDYEDNHDNRLYVDTIHKNLHGNLNACPCLNHNLTGLYNYWEKRFRAFSI